MKYVKPILSVFILIFALFGVLGLISFDLIIPVVVACTAFITYLDAKKMAREHRENDARTLMNAVTFMIALIMIWLFFKFF